MSLFQPKGARRKLKEAAKVKEISSSIKIKRQMPNTQESKDLAKNSKEVTRALQQNR